MRQGRSSSTTIKHEIKEIQIDKLNGNTNSKLKEEAHLSGAYIRSLVKQLTSSKTNMTIPNKDPHKRLAGDQALSETQQPPPPPPPPPHPQQQQHKKQVRRRLHTSRPYQERLLNMAEARREIVTALKFHRASMKQQQSQDQPPPPPQPEPEPEPEPPQSDQDQSAKVKCRRNHRIYPSSSGSSNNNNPPLAPYSPTPSFSPYQTQNPFLWPHNNSTIIPTSTPFGDHQTLANFPLPNQALGLNLNFQDFKDIDLASTTITAAAASSSSSSTVSAGLHAAMDDEEIAEIKSLGEQHQMEWSDTMNLVSSAYWSNFLRPPGDDHHDFLIDHHDNQYPLDDQFHHHQQQQQQQQQQQLMEFPSWLSGGGNENHHFDDCYSSDDYFNSPSLSCMDIGEIEGMDGDWLA